MSVPTIRTVIRRNVFVTIIEIKSKHRIRILFFIQKPTLIMTEIASNNNNNNNNNNNRQGDSLGNV